MRSDIVNSYLLNRPPQSEASCRLSARHILKKAILQAHLSKTTRILMIYKGRHIFSPLSMPGTLLDCGGLQLNLNIPLWENVIPWYILNIFSAMSFQILIIPNLLDCFGVMYVLMVKNITRLFSFYFCLTKNKWHSLPSPVLAGNFNWIWTEFLFFWSYSPFC